GLHFIAFGRSTSAASINEYTWCGPRRYTFAPQSLVPQLSNPLRRPPIIVHRPLLKAITIDHFRVTIDLDGGHSLEES
ncbi:MAG: hypothetical protein ACTS4T_01645, partial [Candidatus Hodgkinia cicadicola]